MANITVVGRAVRDPAYTPANGDKPQYAKFTIAEDHAYGDGTSYFNCVCFGKFADSIYKNLLKGRLVEVVGRFEQDEPYTDRNGNKRREWTLRLERIRYWDSRANGSGNQQTTTPATTPAATPATVPEQTNEPVPDGFEQIEEDIPF